MSISTHMRVHLLGGTALTRDLLNHLLNESGIEVSDTPELESEDDVLVFIAETEDATAMVNRGVVGRSVVIADIDPDSEEAAGVILAGADAVVGFSCSAQDLAAAVRTVSQGGAVVNARAARRVVDIARATSALTAAKDTVLTRRETDILLSIRRGDSVKQTANTLGISAKTVENLQSRLFRKLKVRNRAQAFAQAHALGLLPLPEVEEATVDLRDEANAVED